MRIIKASFLRAAARQYPRASKSLASWVATVHAAKWRNAVEMKKTFPTVDAVKVGSGKTVYVFNVRRNEFRLIAAVHFNQLRVYALRFLSHKEYDRNKWKQEL